MKNKYLIQHVIGTLVTFALLFISAGHLDYWQGQLYAGIAVAMFVLNYTLLRPDAELLAERSAPGENTQKGDKKILGLLALLTLALYIVAGLDSGRFLWSPVFTTGYHVLGVLLTVTGQLLFLIAQKQNKFFSSVVRIQHDRGHAVYTNGLYKIVRHPAYLGLVMQSLGFPLFFGSLWSALPAAASILLLIVRTQREDNTLQKELTGYAEYSVTTRYRLFPYIW